MTKAKKAKPEPGKRTTAVDRNKRGEPRGNKSGKRPDADRVAEVQNLVTLQYNDSQIIRRISRPIAEGGFGVGEKTVRADLARVYGDLRAAREQSRDDRASAVLGTAQAMFRKCHAEGDRKTGAVYFDKICRIEGAYAPDALKLLTIDVAAIASLPDSDLNAEIAAEVRKLLGDMPREKRAALLASLDKEP